MPNETEENETMAKQNEQNGASVVDNDTLAELREAARNGDAGAALELYNATKSAKGRNPDYKYDPRTPVATDAASGDTYGVVTWHPADSDKKYHYPIRVDAHSGAIEIVHGKNGKPIVLAQASDMKTFITAMKMAGTIAE